MSDMSPEHSESRSTGWIVAWIARAITYLLYAYVLIVEVILVVGFLLKLFGASRASGFVDWWYRHLEDVMEPFRGIFGSIELGTTSNDVPAVFETSILFAMIVYGIVAIALHSLITWLSGVIDRIEHRRLEDERRRAYEEALARAQRPYDPTQRQGAVPSYPTAGPSTGAVPPSSPGSAGAPSVPSAPDGPAVPGQPPPGSGTSPPPPPPPERGAPPAPG
jgi:hypothetical protein